jgi:cell division protein FtsQ
METDYSNLQYASRSTRGKKKKKTRNIVLLIALLLIALFILFLLLPISKISDITLDGVKLLSEEKIMNQAKVYLGKSYFLVNPESITIELEKLSICKSATVEKTFPGKLAINIVENDGVAYLYDNDRWYLVLENGYITEWITKLDFSELPIITDWADKGLIEELAVGLSNTMDSVIAELSEIQLHNTEDNQEQVLIFTREGYIVYLELKDFSSKMNIYLDIVETLRSKDAGLGNIYLFDSIRFEKFSGKNPGN